MNTEKPIMIMKNLDETQIFATLMELYLDYSSDFPLPQNKLEDTFFNYGYHKGRVDAIEEAIDRLVVYDEGKA